MVVSPGMNLRCVAVSASAGRLAACCSDEYSRVRRRISALSSAAVFGMSVLCSPGYFHGPGISLVFLDLRKRDFCGLRLVFENIPVPSDGVPYCLLEIPNRFPAQDPLRLGGGEHQ